MADADTIVILLLGFFHPSGGFHGIGPTHHGFVAVRASHLGDADEKTDCSKDQISHEGPSRWGGLPLSQSQVVLPGKGYASLVLSFRLSARYPLPLGFLMAQVGGGTGLTRMET